MIVSMNFVTPVFGSLSSLHRDPAYASTGSTLTLFPDDGSRYALNTTTPMSFKCSGSSPLPSTAGCIVGKNCAA